MPIIDGISAIAVYDPDTGTTVEISKLIANTFEFSKIDFEAGEVSATGGSLYKGDSSSCSFSFLDPGGTIADQMLSWKQARTRVSLVAVGPSVAVQWQEKDHVSISPSTLGGMIKGRADRWDFSIGREGHGVHNIYRAANLLSYLGWTDSDSDDVPDNYTADLPGGGTTAFNFSSNYTLQLNADEQSGIYADIVLPFGSTAMNLRLSAEATELHTVSSEYRLKCQWVNYAGTLLGTANVTTATALGVTSVAAPSQTGLTSPYALRVWPIIMPSSSSGTMTGANFCLRLDNSSTYTRL